MKKSLKLMANNIDVVQSSSDHSNKLKFKATVMYLDQFSDGSPCGADGLKIVLTREEALAKAETMNLMGVDCVWDDWNFPEENMTGHDERNKIGVVEKCYVEGNELKVDALIYKNDFPDVAYFIKNAVDSLGFSVEALCNFDEVDGGFALKDVEFTGVAMLFKETASYKETYIDYISAKDAKYKQGESMTKEEKAELFEEIKASVAEIANEIMDAKLEAKAKVDAEEAMKAENEALKAELAKIKAEAEQAKEVKAEETEEPAEKEEKEDEVKASEEKADGVITSDLKTKVKFSVDNKYTSIGSMYADFLASK